MKKEWIKTEAELEGIRTSGQELARIVTRLEEKIVPGVSTFEIDRFAEEWIREVGGIPIFKGYGGRRPFPATICASLNNEVVHGIPSKEKILREGDLFKLDIGMRFSGMVSDMARTFSVGKVSPLAEKLLRATRESLDCGIAAIHTGASLFEYAHAVEDRARRDGFSMVRDLVGHGVGRELHEEPQIPNYTTKSIPGFTFVEGMAVALEPMVNAGDWQVELSDDGWTFVTADESLSAHFEDTVLITKDGVEVATRL